MKKLFFVLILFLSAVCVRAQDENVIISLRDINTNDIVTNAVAEAAADGVSVSMYVDEENPLQFGIADGSYMAVITRMAFMHVQPPAECSVS